MEGVVEASVSELNIMKGVTADKDDINKLNGLTATQQELNLYLEQQVTYKIR